mmetsp:Transcript_14280/g.21695  ORF Transcript_14280/g.21695 Transcript_14280/m.21695 type:complete len:589 (+) Transcript_14280:109-1875(+)
MMMSTMIKIPSRPVLALLASFFIMSVTTFFTQMKFTPHVPRTHATVSTQEMADSHHSFAYPDIIKEEHFLNETGVANLLFPSVTRPIISECECIKDLHKDYAKIYDKYLAPLDTLKPGFKLLETGMDCRSGGSRIAKVWKKIIPSAQVYAMENDGTCTEENLNAGFGEHVQRIDLANPEALKGMISNTGKFDVVIHDGAHSFDQQRTTLKVMLTEGLQPGGIIIIEDLHASFDCSPYEKTTFSILRDLLYSKTVYGDFVQTISKRVHGKELANYDTLWPEFLPKENRWIISIIDAIQSVDCFEDACVVVKKSGSVRNTVETSLFPLVVQKALLRAQCDKNNHRDYHKIYDKYLAPLNKLKPGFKFLEIGIGCISAYTEDSSPYSPGRSIAVWKDLIPSAEIHAMEYDEKCAEGTLRKEFGDRLHVGDQAKREDLRKLLRRSGKFDFIIDDGGHSFDQQKTTLKTMLFEGLKRGGIIVVEDIESSAQTRIKNKLWKKVGRAILPNEGDSTLDWFYELSWSKTLYGSFTSRELEVSCTPDDLSSRKDAVQASEFSGSIYSEGKVNPWIAAVMPQIQSVECFEDACVVVKK